MENSLQEERRKNEEQQTVISGLQSEVKELNEKSSDLQSRLELAQQRALQAEAHVKDVEDLKVSAGAVRHHNTL